MSASMVCTDTEGLKVLFYNRIQSECVEPLQQLLTFSLCYLLIQLLGIELSQSNLVPSTVALSDISDLPAVIFAPSLISFLFFIYQTCMFPIIKKTITRVNIPAAELAGSTDAQLCEHGPKMGPMWLRNSCLIFFYIKKINNYKICTLVVNTIFANSDFIALS